MSFSTWVGMGGYAIFVWPAYGIAAAALGLLAAVTLRRYRMAQRRLARMMGERSGEDA